MSHESQTMTPWLWNGRSAGVATQGKLQGLRGQRFAGDSLVQCQGLQRRGAGGPGRKSSPGNMRKAEVSPSPMLSPLPTLGGTDYPY
jgi:hypothetical protein